MSQSTRKQQAEAARRAREAEADAKDQRRRRLQLLSAATGVAVVVVCAVIAFGAFKSDPADKGPKTEVGGLKVGGATETAALLRGIPQQGETLGRPDAPVTILEIADLKCPGCKEHEIETQQKIVDRLVRPGKAKLEMQLVNFRDRAAGTTDGEGARRAAYTFAAKNRFWNFVNATYWNQGDEQNAWATERLLRAVAAAAPGIEPAEVNLRETPASRTGIANAERIAAALKTDETPSLYVIPRGSSVGKRVDTEDVDGLEKAVAKATTPAR